MIMFTCAAALAPTGRSSFCGARSVKLEKLSLLTYLAEKVSCFPAHNYWL